MVKTRLQEAADMLDWEFYKTYCRAENLHATTRENSRERAAIETFLRLMREARPHIRGLMSKEDREATS